MEFGKLSLEKYFELLLKIIVWNAKTEFKNAIFQKLCSDNLILNKTSEG